MKLPLTIFFLLPLVVFGQVNQSSIRKVNEIDLPMFVYPENGNDSSSQCFCFSKTGQELRYMWRDTLKPEDKCVVIQYENLNSRRSWAIFERFIEDYPRHDTLAMYLKTGLNTWKSIPLRDSDTYFNLTVTTELKYIDTCYVESPEPPYDLELTVLRVFEVEKEN